MHVMLVRVYCVASGVGSVSAVVVPCARASVRKSACESECARASPSVRVRDMSVLVSACERASLSVRV